jgi:L-malate glycosyltransferase
MIRVLFIARYRDPTMSRKLELLSAEPGLTLWHICPRRWQDELIRVRQSSADGVYRQIAVALTRPADPHRAWYHTFVFGMNRLKPHIVHAEEEPDSLAALQIAMARRLFAPDSKLILNTWQNVDRPLKLCVREVVRATLRASDVVLCANTEAQALLRRRGYDKPAQVLPSLGVDTRIFVPGPATQSSCCTIAFVGRLAVEKGLDTLVDAVQRIVQSNAKPSVRLLIIGDGPNRAETIRHAEKLGSVVQFVGAMPPALIAGYLQQVDALVLPSRSTPVWKEQFGRVLIEAMACRVPVIGSDSGAIPEVIGDAGLIFPEGDAGSLADCLRRLIDSPALRDNLAGRGYARVHAYYTQERIAAQTMALYRQLLA